jgi:hypothetical protein
VESLFFEIQGILVGFVHLDYVREHGKIQSWTHSRSDGVLTYARAFGSLTTVLFSQSPYRFNEECMCSCRCTMQARKATVLNCSIVAPAASADLSMGMFHWDWKRLATTIQTRCLVLCLSKKKLWRICIKSFIVEWTRFVGKNVSFAWAADASLPSA